MTTNRTTPPGADAPAWPRPVVRALRIIAAGCLLIMALLTFVDVVGRFFNAPVYGAAEMIQYLLALTVMAGLGLACVGHAHVAVDIFEPWLNRRFSRAHRGLLWVCNAAALVLMVLAVGRLGIEGLAHDRRSIVLEWPEGGIILFLAALLAAALLLELTGWREPRETIGTGGDSL